MAKGQALSAHAFPAAAGFLGFAAAVDDVGAGEIAEGHGEDVDQAAEGPEGEQHPGGEHVQLETPGGGLDQVCVGLEVEDGAEVGGDGFAVVVRVAGEVAEHGGGEAEHDGADQQDVHELVVAGGGGKHRADGAAAVDQDGGAGQGADAGRGAQSHGGDVVGGFADPDGRGPGLGDEQAADV